MPDLIYRYEADCRERTSLKHAVPTDWCYGKVICALDPFQVQIDQKLSLKKEFLTVRTGVSASSFKVGRQCSFC